MEKVEGMEIKQELLNLIEALSPDQMQQAYDLIREKVGDPVTERMQTWWSENMETKPRVALNLSDEELKDIEENKYGLWADIQHKYDDGEE